MQQCVKTLNKIALGLFALSWIIYLIAGVVGLVRAVDGEVREPLVMGLCMGGVMLSLLIAALAWLLDWGAATFSAWRLERARARVDRRLDAKRKPPGWNRDVLYWFHHGPERRDKSGAFTEAFHERARRG